MQTLVANPTLQPYHGSNTSIRRQPHSGMLQRNTYIKYDAVQLDDPPSVVQRAVAQRNDLGRSYPTPDLTLAFASSRLTLERFIGARLCLPRVILR